MWRSTLRSHIIGYSNACEITNDPKSTIAQPDDVNTMKARLFCSYIAIEREKERHEVKRPPPSRAKGEMRRFQIEKL